MTQSQQYCLRWNNHRTNLLSVFDELLQNESFTDVTLACDEGSPIKAHRMVLAACSPYFKSLFTDLPCKHPVVVLKDVKYVEIKAILEYMYRGEVNVAQNQLAALLKVAEALKVKGLVEENRACKNEKDEQPLHLHQKSSPGSSSSNNSTKQHHPINSHQNSINSRTPSSHSANNFYRNPYNHNNIINNNNNNNNHLNNNNNGHYDHKKPQDPRINLPLWAVPGLPLPQHTAALPCQSHPHPAATAAAAMFTSAYEAVSSDMSPLRRKKLSSLLMQRDTPILRTVLGQRHQMTDNLEPISLVHPSHPSHADNVEMSAAEDRSYKYIKNEIKNEPSEDAQSPYSDIKTEHLNDVEDKSKLAIPSSSPQSFSHHDNLVRTTSNIASYVQSQPSEFRRYKQYTREDIMSAIEAVKNGMSALQAAKKFGVPSRTLYDKVKKLGIVTSRPFKRGSNGSSACFPYSTGGSPYGGHLSENDESINNNTSVLLEASTFLQHALDRGGDEREALAAMAVAAAAHAVASGHSTSPNLQARSPSPSPTMLKYMRHISLTPSPTAPHSDQTNGSSERDEDEDQVEDLSINRKHDVESSRIVMPPIMSHHQQVSSALSAMIKRDDRIIDGMNMDNMRREMRVESGEMEIN